MLKPPRQIDPTPTFARAERDRARAHAMLDTVAAEDLQEVMDHITWLTQPEMRKTWDAGNATYGRPFLLRTDR